MFNHIRDKSPVTMGQINEVKQHFKKVCEIATTLSTIQGNVEVIGSLVETELLSMDKAIEEAANRIQVIVFYILVYILIIIAKFH